MLLEIYSESSWLAQCLKENPRFSSRSFRVSCFLLRSLIHFELNFFIQGKKISVAVLLLWRVTISTATLQSKSDNLGQAYSFRDLWRHLGRHGTEAVAESYILIHHGKGWGWVWHGLLKPQNLPPVTCLLQRTIPTTRRPQFLIFPKIFL